MAEISDGFEISEVDYELRGPGDIAGTMQSGNYNSDVLALSRYTDILEAAVADADRIMEEPGDTDTAYAYERMIQVSAGDNSNII
jgi:ATP-dependent DNA helicase RecG